MYNAQPKKNTKKLNKSRKRRDKEAQVIDVTEERVTTTGHPKVKRKIKR